MTAPYVPLSPFTPTDLSLLRTAKYWLGGVSRAFESIDVKMRSASLRISSLVWETSPMIRMARPGPGNGCLATIESGSPRLRPRALTSSLKRILRGSMILENLMFFGMPPTL